MSSSSHLLAAHQAMNSHDYPAALHDFTNALHLSSDPLSQLIIATSIAIIHLRMCNYTQSMEGLMEVLQKLNMIETTNIMQEEILRVKVHANLMLLHVVSAQYEKVKQHLDELISLIQKSKQRGGDASAMLSVVIGSLYGFPSFQSLFLQTSPHIASIDSYLASRRYSTTSAKAYHLSHSPLFYSALAIIRELVEPNDLNNAYKLQNAAYNLFRQQRETVMAAVSCRHLIHLSSKMKLPKEVLQVHEEHLRKLMQQEEIRGIIQETLFHNYEEKLNCVIEVTKLLMEYENHLQSAENIKKSKKGMIISHKKLFNWEKTAILMKINRQINAGSKNEFQLRQIAKIIKQSDESVLQMMRQHEFVRGAISEYVQYVQRLGDHFQSIYQKLIKKGLHQILTVSIQNSIHQSNSPQRRTSSSPINRKSPRSSKRQRAGTLSTAQQFHQQQFASLVQGQSRKQWKNQYEQSVSQEEVIDRQPKKVKNLVDKVKQSQMKNQNKSAFLPQVNEESEEEKKRDSSSSYLKQNMKQTDSFEISKVNKSSEIDTNQKYIHQFIRNDLNQRPTPPPHNYRSQISILNKFQMQNNANKSQINPNQIKEPSPQIIQTNFRSQISTQNFNSLPNRNTANNKNQLPPRPSVPLQQTTLSKEPQIKSQPQILQSNLGNSTLSQQSPSQSQIQPPSQKVLQNQTIPQQSKSLVNSADEQQKQVLKRQAYDLKLRHYVKECILGQYIFKRHFSSDGGQNRFLAITKDMKKLIWSDTEEDRRNQKCKQYDLADIRGVVYGKCTQTFRKECNRHLQTWKCFSIIFKKRTFDVYCKDDQRDIQFWLPGITILLRNFRFDSPLYNKIKPKKPKKSPRVNLVKGIDGNQPLTNFYSQGRVLWKRCLLRLQHKYLPIPKSMKVGQNMYSCANAIAIIRAGQDVFGIKSKLAYRSKLSKNRNN